MSRQELADAINSHLFRATRKRGAVDEGHVGKWERGVTRWPSARYRAALRAVLDVTTDADLGFRRPQQGATETVDRKTFLRTTFGVGVGAMLVESTTLDAEPDLAAALAGPTKCYRQMESAVPSAQLTPAVEAHLSLALGIVQGSRRVATGYRALSEIAGLSAWLAVDRGDSSTARRRYADAIHFAERTHHPLLVSYMTASLGHFAVEAGDPTTGLPLIQRASVLLDSDAPDAARAWIESLRATAYAALADRAEAMGALSRAESLSNRNRGELRWPWVFAFNSAKVARYQASVLGTLGDVRAATAAYVVARPVLATKPGALVDVEHAHVLVRSGDVAGGCAVAVNALTTARTYGSERIMNRVRQFRAGLPARTIEATALDDALSDLYERGT